MKITKIVTGLVLMGIMTSGFANGGDSTGSALSSSGNMTQAIISPGVNLVTPGQIDQKIYLNNFLINQQLKVRDTQIADLQGQIDAIKKSGSGALPYICTPVTWSYTSNAGAMSSVGAPYASATPCPYTPSPYMD